VPGYSSNLLRCNKCFVMQSAALRNCPPVRLPTKTARNRPPIYLVCRRASYRRWHLRGSQVPRLACAEVAQLSPQHQVRCEGQRRPTHDRLPAHHLAHRPACHPVRHQARPCRRHHHALRPQHQYPVVRAPMPVACPSTTNAPSVKTAIFSLNTKAQRWCGVDRAAANRFTRRAWKSGGDNPSSSHARFVAVIGTRAQIAMPVMLSMCVEEPSKEIVLSAVRI